VNPNSTPPEGLSARETAEQGEKVAGEGGAENGPQAGVQSPDPRAVLLDTISTALNAAGYWLPMDGKRAVADAVLKAGSDGACAIVERVRNAAAIADDTDVTDWQRGYRACADRVHSALNATA